MDKQTAEYVAATKTLMLLFERNSSAEQLEKLKSLLNLLIKEKGMLEEQICLMRVEPEAVPFKALLSPFIELTCSTGAPQKCKNNGERLSSSLLHSSSQIYSTFFIPLF
jgi:hypothetical protein